MQLPSFLGIGVQKAGTSWLHKQLSRHNEIYVPSLKKEVHFFDNNYDKGADWYASHFPCDEIGDNIKAVGEITPKYMCTPEAPSRINSVLGKVPMIVIVRNPVDRLYSQYRMAYTKGRFNKSIESFAKNRSSVFERGLYARQLKNYLEYFDMENILILVYEEVFSSKEAKRAALDSVGRHIGVDPEQFGSAPAGAGDQDVVGSEASSGRPRFLRAYQKALEIQSWMINKNMNGLLKAIKKTGISKRSFGEPTPPPEMTPAQRAWIWSMYEPDVEELEAMLGRRLTAWR